MNPFPRRVSRPAVVVLAAAAAASLAVGGATQAEAESVALSPTGTLVVTMRGNGHGHGMSQYGAQGAAVRGLKYNQILAFYYPGTQLVALKASTIRVRLSGFGATMTVAATPGLRATGATGALPSTAVSKYRFVPLGAGLALQQLPAAAGSVWHTLRAGLPTGSTFARPGGAPVRVYKTSGASTRYYGSVKLYRSGTRAYIVNNVSLDNYTAGVVSSEMPTSWRPQAVAAQAVAARTYGRYAVEHASARNYDICDTTQCQVYGGQAKYDASGHLIHLDYQPAVVATSNRVLRYQGHTIFAQFSASDGGYTAAGGQPYLLAKADPYDPSAPGNPYDNYSSKVSVSSLASQFGFAKLTDIAITRRDGAGAWGGRVDSARLTGLTAAGKAQQLTVSGYQLQWALGSGTTLFTLRRG